MKLTSCLWIKCMFLSLLIGDHVLSFIVEKACPAPAPCRCYGSYHVSCSARHLTTIPAFDNSYIREGQFQMFFNSNNLTVIPTNAFTHLRLAHNVRVQLYLNKNNIYRIDANAFNGITQNIRYIQLDNNNLNAIPVELEQLGNLEVLYIRYNLIFSIDSYTMVSLGSHLQEFYFSLDMFKSWPVSLQFLKVVKELHVTGVNFPPLNNDTFHEIADTLTTISIDGCHLEYVPDAVFELHNLKSFTFSNCDNLTTEDFVDDPCNKLVYNTNFSETVNGTLFETCGQSLTSVTTVHFTYSNLRYVSGIFRAFPAMTTVDLSHNDLTFIHWDEISDNNVLTYLNLGYNNFSRIPSVINKLKSLTILYLRNNNLGSVEDYDIFSLTSLRELYLTNNPIDYLSPQAFSNNNMLIKLDLRGTAVHSIPRSVADLTRLRSLYLPQNEIDCSCSLVVLGKLSNRNIDITGYCAARSETVQAYITRELRHCH